MRLLSRPVPQIPKETIEKVLDSTDIVDLISSYIPVKRAGAAFKANCPFHHEKTPSFTINPQRQTFHCFGCQKHGNAIGFVMDYEGLPFLEAVKKLADKAAIPIVQEAYDPQADMARRSQGRLKDLQREAAEFFHTLLLKDPQAQHARDYLKSRGFGKEMAERWKLGWMPRNPQIFKDWVKARKYTGRELVDGGLAGMKEEGNPKAGIFIRFNDRLMFPIRNDMGDPIAFSGRVLREDQQGGKYQNSPETPIFKKSNVLFALDRAKKMILKEKTVLVCEGQIDAICCHEQGVEHAVAPLGTAFTSQHARILRRYANNALLCYDADGAGLAASEKAFAHLVAEGVSAKVVEMPAGDDPDSFLKTHGIEAFKKLLAEAKDFFEFKLDRAKATGQLDTMAGRTKVSNGCTALLAAMSDHAAREHQINVVAIHLGIAVRSIWEGIEKVKKQPQRAERGAEVEQVSGPVEATPMHRIVSALCHLALTSGTAQHFLAEQFETLHEADRWIEGIPLLERILAVAPDPASTAAINAFMGDLSEGDRLALLKDAEYWNAEEGDGLSSAEQSLALLSSAVLQKRDAAITAALKEHGLAPERIVELMQAKKELKGLMAGMRQRSEFDDQLPPSTWKSKEPEWKKKWKK